MMILNSLQFYHNNMLNYTHALKQERVNQQEDLSTFCLRSEGRRFNNHHGSFQGKSAVLNIFYIYRTAMFY